MADTDLTLTRLRLAVEQSEALQHGLRLRQEDLLSLEKGVPDVASGRTTGLVLIDQAEDIRRAVNIHVADHLAEIRVALTRADVALADAMSDRTVPPEVVRTLGRLVNAAGEETRRATQGLEHVDLALSRISRALPGEPGLAKSAQLSIDQAAGRLENARRATFRVVQGLPGIIRAIEELPLEDPATAQLDIARAPATPAQRNLGVVTEMRRVPPSSRQPTTGVSPGR